MKIRNNIPNFITLMNLLSGLFSLYLGMQGNLKLAAFMVFAAAIFDFFDGMLARALNAKSEIGGQLDSLADIVSFGVAPAFLLFHTFRLQEVGIDEASFLPFISFMVPLFSAWRLAKFNVDEEQSTYFKGLPTPATGILLASIPITILVCLADNEGWYYELLTNPWFLTVTAIACSFLMVSSLPMFALKFRSAVWSENQIRYIFLIISVFLIILLKFASIPVIILIYLLLSVITAVVENASAVKKAEDGVDM